MFYAWYCIHIYAYLMKSFDVKVWYSMVMKLINVGARQQLLLIESMVDAMVESSTSLSTATRNQRKI